ncbi:TonB-dependent receptor [Calditrichota bacterium GD2]
MRRILIAILLIGSFSGIHARQQPSADTLAVFTSRDSIVVIGNRIATSVRNLAYSYQIVSGEMVQQLSSHSALEMVDLNFPSAYVLENKALGYGVGPEGAGILNLRGIGGKPNTGVLVLLNGHPDFMGIFGHPLPDVYGNEDIERIEILAGPSSTVFGDHAMGGVVNLVTAPQFKHLARVRAEFGSFGTQIFSVALQKKIANNGLFFTARKQKSDGHISQTSFESLHLQGGWQYQINPAWKLLVQGRYVPYQFDDPARGDVDRLNLDAYAKIQRGTAEISLQNNTQKWKGAFQLYANAGHHEFYDGFKSDDFSYGLSAYQFMQYSGALAFAGGMDVIYYGGKAKNDFAKLPNGAPIVNPEAHDLTSAGVYGVVFYTPLPQVNLKAGLRYQYNSLPLNQISPFLGASYTMANGLHFYLNYQTGFRAPTLMELYLFPSANPDLKNEKVQSVELGTSFAYSKSGQLRVALFKNKARDLIQALPTPTPPPPTRFVNGPQSDQWGVEVLIKQKVLSNLFAQIGYGFLEPDLLTAYNPKHQIKYLLSYQKERYYLSVYGKFVQKLYAGNNETLPLPDYHLLNVQAGVNVFNLDLFVRLLNALDENYLSRPDFPAPGRQVRVGFTFRL